MTLISCNPESPQAVYDNLKLLEEVDIDRSATYRELAQTVLADPQVSLGWRQAIAEQLNQANHLLAMATVGREDSY
jgi:hypothetical protein